MSPIQPSAPSESPDITGAVFGRSADGMPVALVAENAYAMVPAAQGKHYLAGGWRIARPMAEWTRADFYGHGGDLADEAAFRAKVLGQAQHQEERRRLGRRDIPGGAHTPWGPSQGGTVYAEGVTSHSTAGHGGFKLSADRNRKVHPMLRATGGWYEEDECWAIVAITFPHLFTALEHRHAERALKDAWPDAWETIFGTILGPGDSLTKDKRAFDATHANDWIVVSAITSVQQAGFVECVATLGGKRGSEERRFLVPSAEYKFDRFGFVIDPDRHAVHAGPSSFVGWQGRHDPCTRTAPRALPHAGRAPANSASTGSGRPPDHAAHDRTDPWSAPATQPLSSPKGTRRERVPRELSRPACRADGGAPAGNRRPVAQAGSAGAGDRHVRRVSRRSRRDR